MDALTVPSNDFGLLTHALIAFWERFHSLDWQNRIHFLAKPQ